MKTENIQSSSFENIAEIYNEIRPGYPSSLYKKILDYKKLDRYSTILELGAGHGIATKEILDFYNSKVIAVEPGKQLCNYIIEKTKGNVKLEVCNLLYEDFHTENKFDAIFSATAFHWIKKELKYQKTYNELKNDGILVLFWNNFSINDRSLNEEIQKIYRKHGFSVTANKSIYDIQEEKIQARKLELIDSSFFTLLDSGTILNTYDYTSEMYCKLLQSFSDHSTKDKNTMAIFYRDISKLIITNHNTIKIDIVIDYLIAKKSL